MYEQYSYRPSTGGLSMRTVLPFVVFLFFLAFWTYELLAENPVPEEISRLIPNEWKFWLAKGLHVGAYAFLTMLAAWLPVHRAFFRIIIAGLLLHGVATEFGQRFTSTRSGSMQDVALDWIGVGLGLLALGGLRQLVSAVPSRIESPPREVSARVPKRNNNMQRVTFRAGEILFQEGEPANHAFLVESGKVEVLTGYPESARVVGAVHANEVVGEMALIGDRPRRNTVRAATEVRAAKVSRDEFVGLLRSDPSLCAPYLSRLFERLRELDAQQHTAPESPGERDGKTSGKFQLRLYPLSRYAVSILSDGGLSIDTFPFRLGRASEASEPSAIDLNDLWLLDKPPFYISRNHMAFDLVGGSRYIVRDRGSNLGTIVNEKLIGGKSSAREVELEEGDNVVILGARNSPFQFRAVLERVSS